MIGNLILVAIRNLNRYRFYTIINLIGLTFGIMLFLIIMHYVRFEMSFDRHHVHADRIYRVDWNMQFGENSSHNAAVTPPMAAVIVRDFPEVEAAVRLRYAGGSKFRNQDDSIQEWRVVYTDNQLFEIFTVPFISGDPATALTEPNTVVLTEAAAKQLFSGEDPVGKTLLQDDKTLLKVTGVVRDMPVNSHFHYRLFLSLEGLAEARSGNWIGGPYNTYLLLRKDADVDALGRKLQSIVKDYVVPQASATFGSVFTDDFVRGGNSLTLELRPMLDIHLHSHLRNELEGNSDIKYVYLFLAVALIVIVLAGVNFVNLSTARSVKRAREVGIRKVLGSDKRRLEYQFFAESLALTITASIFAAGLSHVFLPVFNVITDLDLQIYLTDPVPWAITLGTGVVIGILAGIYPALILSSYNPVKVLKGTFVPQSGSLNLRSGLVVFQFSLSITLIIGTLALEKQMQFVQSREIGFNKQQVILLHDVKNAADKLPAFRNEVLRSGIVSQSTISSYFPGPGSARKTPMLWRYGTDPSPGSSLNLEMWTVDHDYVPTLGIELLTGRNFSLDFPSDSSAVLLNQTAARQFGFGADAVGQMISSYFENPDGSPDNTKLQTWTVIGVVKDFNYESLREEVEPLGLFFGSSNLFMAFRYNTVDTRSVVDLLETQWKRIVPGEPFYYSFLDEKFNTFYRTDEKVRDIFWVFSVLAMLIASLGLFALTAFSTEQKTKEIGIRKVLGATTNDILVLLSGRFAFLVFLAFMIAVPAGAYMVNWYLEQYTYRTEIGLSIFIYSGIGAIVIAMLTMAYHAIHAARNNPADALKSD